MGWGVGVVNTMGRERCQGIYSCIKSREEQLFGGLFGRIWL